MHRFHLVLFQSGADLIDRAVVSQLQQAIAEQVTTPRDQTMIDVWLHSPGGDANATFKLHMSLRHHAARIRAIVPDFAKSAATLLTLGMDEIFMGHAAELGPLDLQVEHPLREGEIVSALDISQSASFFVKFAIDMAVRGGAAIHQATGLPRGEVLNTSLQFLAQFLDPLASKLDPHLVHQAANHLRVAEGYALRMMGTVAKSDGKRVWAEQNAKKIVEKLVRSYPAHEYVICREEARNLGLPVGDIEEYDRCSDVLDLWRQFFAPAGSGPGSFAIILSDADLPSQSNPAKGSQHVQAPLHGQHDPTSAAVAAEAE